MVATVTARHGAAMQESPRGERCAAGVRSAARHRLTPPPSLTVATFDNGAEQTRARRESGLVDGFAPRMRHGPETHVTPVIRVLPCRPAVLHPCPISRSLQ